MDQNQNKQDLKNKLFSIYKENKKKVIIFVFLLIIIISFSFLLKLYNDKQNIQISEKYIKAGIYLTSNKIDESKKLYEEIILSKNKFYSGLALSVLIEKNLESDNNKIIDYFDIIENLADTSEKKDLILFKKALYLIKHSKVNEGNKILKNLKNSDSKIKFLVEEILVK